MNLREAQEAWHREYFVGRAEALALIQRAVDGDPALRVLYLHGPGGIGKTTLLTQATAKARAAGAPITRLDGRAFEANPSEFRVKITGALEGGAPGRQVVVVDGYERLVPVDTWLCNVFLPELGEDVVLLLAGRNPPSSEWRALPGWNSLVRGLPVDSLTSDEARQLLDRRRVDQRRHDDALRVTHGHPLALWLLADALERDPALALGEIPLDVVRSLVAAFVDSALPSAAHRRALELAAIVRNLDEPLLSDVLELDDARPIFDWLASQAWVEVTGNGLTPHDLFRDTLSAELRWRNSAHHADLVARAASHYTKRFPGADLSEQARLQLDRAFLHRDLPLLRDAYDWRAMARLRLEAATRRDHQPIVELVRHHEGDEAAAIVARWLMSPAASAVIFRDPDGELAFFNLNVMLDRASDEERLADPGTSAAWSWVARQGGLRPGEVAVQSRAWMSRDAYQLPSPHQGAHAFWGMRSYMAIPGLRFLFHNNTMPEVWLPMTEAMGIQRVPEAEFDVDGRHHTACVSDFRKESVADYLDRVVRAAQAGSEPSIAPRTEEPFVQLGRAEFDKAVRGALRQIGSTSALAENPLSHSRLVWLGVETPAATPEARARVLEARLREGIGRLASNPAGSHAARVLEATWLRPHDGQKALAGSLGLTFGTYRRHLGEGADLLCELLWALETSP